MPQNKNQHFIPQFYLRRFAPSSNDRLINVLEIGTGATHYGASIRGQASKAYFYGRGDEGYFDWYKLEHPAAAIIDRVAANGPPVRDSQDHIVLTIFLNLLHARTQYAADAYVEAVYKVATATST